jgi:ribosomal protein S18 acetylase RimI-like enzyme
MENVFFHEIKDVDWKVVDRIAELEKRNFGKDAAINQWVIPVIIRYGKLIVASKDNDGAEGNNGYGIIGACEIIKSWEEDSTAFIHSFYIDKEYRNKSIGKRLLQEVIDILKSSSIEIVELTVNPANEPAIKLYRGAGFKKTGFRKNEYGRGVDRDLMALRF